ncbi:MAG: NAD-dependent epimerase/dehydratase family protein [Mariprofundaceae bacterium]
MNVLVTGAAGFIGRHLCQRLAEQGMHVTALLRTATDGPWHEARFGDLTDNINASLLQGMDIVFHLAGKVHALSESDQDAQAYFEINSEATHRLLKTAQQANVGKFIYFSSVKAAGDVDGLMDESIDCEADTAYGQSKRAAEKLVLEGGFVPHPVVIRPAMVYGRSKRGNFQKMIRSIAQGNFPSLPETRNKRSMVHVDDVVTAAILAAEKSQAAGRTYIVTDGQSYSTRQIYEWICQALNKPVPRWRIPVTVLKLMALLGDAIGKVRGRRFMFDSDTLDKLTGSAFYSSQRIERELGFKAVFDLQQSLPEIIRFLGVEK